MYKSLSCILGLFCIFIACQSRKNNDQSSVASNTQFHVEAFREINLADHLSDCGEELLMSLFIEDVEYIKPETTDQSLIGYISKIQLTPHFLFVKSDGENSLIKMFSRDGAYIRSLGKLGQGPGETNTILGFSATDSLVYVKAAYRSGFFVYRVHDNQFIQKIVPSKDFEALMSASADFDLMDNNIVCYPGFIPEGQLFPQYVSTVCIVGADGTVVTNQSPYLGSSFYANCPQFVMIDRPRHWFYDNSYNAYSVINDTIYGVSLDSIFPRYHLNLGRYKLPVSEYQISRQSRRENYILMMSIAETKDFLLLTYVYGKRWWYSFFNKQTGGVKSWSQSSDKIGGWFALDTPGITNDIDGGVNIGGFRYIDDRHVYSIIDVVQADKLKATIKDAKVKFPEKKAELMRLLDEMGEDDNPIIAIYKLKD